MRPSCLWILSIWMMFFLFTRKTEAGKIPTSRAQPEINNYLDSYIVGQNGFDFCKSHALKGHCSYYSCLDDTIQCFGSKHNRSVAFRFCDRTRHHEQDFSPEGRTWAENTNRCILKTIASGRDLGREDWCTQVDKATKDALLECARSADICQVLWTDREVIYKIFSSRSWLTVVEAAKHCPRTTVNSYIFWTLGQMHVY